MNDVLPIKTTLPHDSVVVKIIQTMHRLGYNTTTTPVRGGHRISTDGVK